MCVLVCLRARREAREKSWTCPWRGLAAWGAWDAFKTASVIPYGQRVTRFDVALVQESLMTRVVSQVSKEKQKYVQLTWIVVGLWFAFCLFTLDYNGAFFDEGIYITAGQRTWEGHGLTDGYLGWFAGSLLWPVIAGVGARVGGLLGARVLATAMAAVAFVGLVLASRNIFGERAAFWTAVAFALSAPFLALSRLAVYDSTALAGIGVSFWAITELERRDHRFWLVVAAVAFCWALLAKYPTGLMLLPLMGVLLALRRGKGITDLFVFGFISGAITLALFLPVRERVMSFFSYRLANSPASNVTQQMIAADLVRLSIVSLLLAAGGWWAARGRRGLASVLILSLAMWPVYHLVLRDSVSRSKHIVLGFLFAYPLVGLALSTLWGTAGRRIVFRRVAAGALVVGLIAICAVQLTRFNHDWPDARPAARYLLSEVQPGQKLLINESWPYTMYLYTAGRIDSPWDVFDVYRITHGESEIGLCEYDWFVDSQAAYQWPGYIAFQVYLCGSFEPVYTAMTVREGMGPDLRYVRSPVKVVVWENKAR
jgi:hypothetical protein